MQLGPESGFEDVSKFIDPPEIKVSSSPQLSGTAFQSITHLKPLLTISSPQLIHNAEHPRLVARHHNRIIVVQVILHLYQLLC
jgi:hypothetical protein